VPQTIDMAFQLNDKVTFELSGEHVEAVTVYVAALSCSLACVRADCAWPLRWVEGTVGDWDKAASTNATHRLPLNVIVRRPSPTY
jgi:hypothetical protein